MEGSVCTCLGRCTKAQRGDVRLGREQRHWPHSGVVLLFPVTLQIALALLGKGKELLSPALTLQRRKTDAPSLLYFTLSPFHGAEAQLTPVELDLLNCTEGKRGLRAPGDFKSRLQGGQPQGETATLHLQACLLGTGDGCLEWEAHIQHAHWKC